MSRLFDGLRSLAAVDDLGIVLDVEGSALRSCRVSTDLTDVIARAMSLKDVTVLIGDLGVAHPGERILGVLSPCLGECARTLHHSLEWQQADRRRRWLRLRNGTITAGSGATSRQSWNETDRSVLLATDRPTSPHRNGSLGPFGVEVAVGFRDPTTDVQVDDVLELAGVLDALLTIRSLQRRVDAGR